MSRNILNLDPNLLMYDNQLVRNILSKIWDVELDRTKCTINVLWESFPQNIYGTYSSNWWKLNVS